jgi:branched-chain amino acid transport system permease protein
MEFVVVSVLNGLSYGFLLFLLSAGLTLVFSMLGVINFAHAGFYMLGAYVGWSVAGLFGFWVALILAPLAVGALGVVFERLCLRRVRTHGRGQMSGHVAELLLTFGFAFVILEVVQLLWGRSPIDFHPPPLLRGTALTLVNTAGAGLSVVWGSGADSLCAAAGTSCSLFPATRAFMMLTSIVVMVALALLVARTRLGLVVQAALDNPSMLGALGHDVDRVFMCVFGAGAALAALAGVVGGSTFVTEPGMAAAVGSVVFVVVVVGGLGSLTGALLASLFVGLLQTFAASLDVSVVSAVAAFGLTMPDFIDDSPWMHVTTARVAPLLPYLLLVITLWLRPMGLLGDRET